ncbi:integrase family protein [Rhizobium sp. PDO1-076]|uniref:tyrosine-type recombinase/integrase n=1 Tax=Rhizobium sp. PDO1-076 TaxID=1125979 RepID=UPI00024E2D97|nr:integrase family protein [Rhizobium sp. PDO1-076]
MWREKQETASRTRGRIEMVIDYAAARGLRSTTNPARWKGHLETLLSARKKLQRGHHAALPYAELPDFMKALEGQAGTAALALKFLILTAARTGEVIGARWDEVDLEAETWTVPAERMKAGKIHTVPLSKAAVVLLKTLPRIENNPYVFPGLKEGKPLSNMAMLAVLKRMKREDLTGHGFRSCFRDWAGNETSFPREIVEEALAHTLGGVEAAYRRQQAIERRRELMAAWANFSLGTPAGIVPIRPSKAS